MQIAREIFKVQLTKGNVESGAKFTPAGDLNIPPPYNAQVRNILNYSCIMKVNIVIHPVVE